MEYVAVMDAEGVESVVMKGWVGVMYCEYKGTKVQRVW